MNKQDHVLAFYSRHPISREQILAGVVARRGHLEALVPDDLFPFDQDHYGGLAMVEALAERADIGANSEVADFCGGLAGPARYLAHRYGAFVTCIELNPQRAPAAADLTSRVGLADRVRIVRADVARVPLASACMDAVISQEAFLHLPDKAAALREAYRVLKPGGRLAFTDWAEHRPLSTNDAEAMWRGIAAQSLQSFAGYIQQMLDLGFRHVQTDDLTQQWGKILEDRYAMYCALREQNEKLGMPSGDAEFYGSYARLVALVQEGTLGGGRFTALK